MLKESKPPNLHLLWNDLIDFLSDAEIVLLLNENIQLLKRIWLTERYFLKLLEKYI